jgi:hypothetical protein
LPVSEENCRQDDFKDPNRHCHRVTSVVSVWEGKVSAEAITTRRRQLTRSLEESSITEPPGGDGCRTACSFRVKSWK